MAGKAKPRLVRLYTDVLRKRFWRVKFADAKRPVEVPIHLSRELIKRSKRGIVWECVLADGIKDFALANPTAFPHPVKHVYVIRGVIYVVDKIDGVPTHAVRYFHDFGSLTYAFDKISKERFTKQFGDRGFLLRMRPAVKRGGDELHGARETRDRQKAAGTPSLSRGALGRAQAAGLELPATA
jgi:hypothetical protein